MQQSSETKYAFKNKAGDTVMLLDNYEHAVKWYRNKLGECGPLMPNYTLHAETILREELDLPRPLKAFKNV